MDLDRIGDRCDMTYERVVSWWLIDVRDSANNILLGLDDYIRMALNNICVCQLSHKIFWNETKTRFSWNSEKMFDQSTIYNPHYRGHASCVDYISYRGTKCVMNFCVSTSPRVDLYIIFIIFIYINVYAWTYIFIYAYIILIW